MTPELYEEYERHPFYDPTKASVFATLSHVLPIGFLLRKIYGLNEEESNSVVREMEREQLNREASVIAVKLDKLRQEYAEATGVQRVG